jgi:hypothetical protein
MLTQAAACVVPLSCAGEMHASSPAEADVHFNDSHSLEQLASSILRIDLDQQAA